MELDQERNVKLKTLGNAIMCCLFFPLPFHQAEYGQWMEWRSWSECNKSCGTGLQFRFRLCAMMPGQEACQGTCPFLSALKYSVKRLVKVRVHYFLH